MTVEPVPHLARLLDLRDARRTSGWSGPPRATAPGTARLWLPSGDQGDRGVSSLVRRDIHARALDVPCLTLDSLDLRDVDFIKIDVDGNELAVLRGATHAPRPRPPGPVHRVGGPHPADRPVVSYLAERGYGGWVLPDDTWLPLSSFDLEAHQSRTSHVASQGLLRRVLPFRRPGYVRYVNSVLFLPDGRRPGRRAPHADTYATMGRMPPAKRPARPAGPFTPLDFQLVLLRRMADHNPDLVEDARHALGVSIADMREANRRWQAMRHAPRARGAVSRYRSILGEPESVDTPADRRPVLRGAACGRFRSGPTCASRCSWPRTAPPGTSGWSARPAPPAPELRTLEDLTPWSCTVDEAARAFAPARPLEGTAPTRWGLAFTAPDASGVRQDCVAEFTWGLLQRVAVTGPQS